MIIVENLVIENQNYTRTYSDSGMKIQRQDGMLFDDSIDPADSGRTYIETDIPIEQGEEDYAAIVRILLGEE